VNPMQRRYVLPTDPTVVGISEWMPELQTYGIDITFMTQEVLNAYLSNGKDRSAAGLMNYVTEVLNHQLETNFNTSGQNSYMRVAYEQEMDRMSLICLEATDTLYEHLKKHFVAIEDREASLGTRTQIMEWEVSDVTGKDVIIRVSIDEESEQSDSGRV